MEFSSYRQFIEEINKGNIIKAVFRVRNYAHYRSCVIERKTDVFNDGDSMVKIDVKLTGDGVEQFCFYKVFNEKNKLFDMWRKGKYTLQQMWKNIEFTKIDYNT